jgi:dipeptidyl aminopeptidase/acylaminoacyl peptidase
MTVLANAFTTIHPARTPGRDARPLTAEDLCAMPRVGAPVLSPNGATLAVTVTTYDLEKNQGRGRIWLMSAAAGHEGGDARPLTAAEVSSNEPVFSPDGTRLAFTRKGENGKSQLQLLPLAGGESQKLTDLPLGVFDPRWLPDGSGIVFASMVLKDHWTPEATRAEIERREKDPVKAHVTESRVFRFWDTWLTTGETPHLFVIDLASGALRDLTPESDAWFDWMEPQGQFDISPDGTEVVFSGIILDGPDERLRAALFRVPIAGGAIECLTPRHPADDLRPRYAPDGGSILFGMTQDPFFYADRVRLMKLDRATRQVAPVLADWDRSPAHWDFGRDGSLWFVAEDAGRTSVFTLDPRAARPEARERLRGGTVTALATTADKRVFVSLQNLSQPPEIFVAGEGAPRQVTHFTGAVLDHVALGEVRELQFEGSYGETVQMFVTLPPGFDPEKRYPLVQVVHGGPHAISGDVFHFRWQPHLFAAPGYVVAMVNFQGSTSWGQDFAKRIQGGWGDRPFQDVMKATDLLVSSGWVDERRMAAAGGSYGGYLVSWIAGHTDRFRCIVNHAGVYDLLSQYASDVTQGRAQSMGGEPWEGLEAIERWSPARFAKGFNTPMLVIHGERDFRVPVTQGLECYGVLKAKGVPARLVYFPDENHWVLKARNSLLWYREVHAWLERWLTA